MANALDNDQIANKFLDINFAIQKNSDPTKEVFFSATSITASREQSIQDKDGIIALISDISTSAVVIFEGSYAGGPKTFTLSPAPSVVTSVIAFRNGIKGKYGGSNDYTVSGSTLTWISELLVGEEVSAVYNTDAVAVDRTININIQTGTSYTVTESDNGGMVLMDNAAANTVTFPEDSTENLSGGFNCTVKQLGAGQTSIAVEGSDTLLIADRSPGGAPNPMNKIRTQAAAVTVIKYGSGTYTADGDLTN